MKPFLASVSLLVLALTGCTVMPTGPSVTVLPGSTKSFEQFRYDDVNCLIRTHAGGRRQRSRSTSAGSAVVGTAIGALAGAALGGNHEVRGGGRWHGPADGLQRGAAIRNLRATAASAATTAPMCSACMPAATRCRCMAACSPARGHPGLGLRRPHGATAATRLLAALLIRRRDIRRPRGLVVSFGQFSVNGSNAMVRGPTGRS